ncbi:MAG: alpha/beta hydrolase [Deinococcales bacterium]
MPITPPPHVMATLQSQVQVLAQVDIYLAPKPSTDLALIIFPGGGYRHLAAHEGRDYAEFFQAQGISSFVLHYRLGSEGFRHPAMIEDALAAIETVRKRANDFGINPHKLGIMGSSAGGHLVAHSLVSYRFYERDVCLRADFAILCYPVISMLEHIHQGCLENLLGANPSLELIKTVSPEIHVDETTPPCFIWHTLEDGSVAVEHSLLWAKALRDKRRSFELHLYSKGRHGLGLNSDLAWEQACLRWLSILDQDLLDQGLTER